MNIPEPPQIIGAKRALTEEDVVRANVAMQVLNLAVADARRHYDNGDNANSPIIAADVREAALGAIHRTLTERTEMVAREPELPLQ